MQAKYLIVVALVGIVLLAGFNMMSSSQNEQDRAAMALKTSTASTTGIAESYVEQPVTATEQPITEKPLGEQPKAILDKATTQIDQAQQAELARAVHVEEAQS